MFYPVRKFNFNIIKLKMPAKNKIADVLTYFEYSKLSYFEISKL